MGKAFEAAFHVSTKAIRIEYPADAKVDDPYFRPPYGGLPYIPALWRAGIEISYFYLGKRLDVHALWWDIDLDGDYDAGLAEFFLDGHSFGRGSDALKRLLDMNWRRGSVLQIIMFGAGHAPYRSHNPLEPSSDGLMPEKVLEALRTKGVRFERFEGYKTGPLAGEGEGKRGRKKGSYLFSCHRSGEMGSSLFLSSHSVGN